MSKLTEKVKKKKKRKARMRLVSISSIGVALGFLHAVSAFYLRQIYNVKTLAPAWRITKGEILFSAGDVAILKRDVALKILVNTDVLVAEQLRMLIIIVLLGAIVYLIGSKLTERAYLFLYLGGICGTLYYIFLFAFLRWPVSFFSKDALVLLSFPVIVPVYIPALLSIGALGAGAFLVIKKS
ncbi:MAG: hypothetical protein QME63_04025 [Actinomycetota bacterium]|nr:hypothetical protein [Actinomycetota bacterium]